MVAHSTARRNRRKPVEYAQYCAMLGVSPTASRDEIDAAYRRLVKQHHPDTNPLDSESAVIAYQRSTEAYEAIREFFPRRKPRKRTDRPAPPYVGFPLQPHASGHWSKRIKGRLVYFGRWAKREGGKLIQLPDGGNWQTALAKYNTEIHELQAGRLPRTRTFDPDGLTLRNLCNRFLTSKQQRVAAGELEPRSFREYKEATDLLIAECGSHRLVDDLRPEDFESLRSKFTEKWGPHRVGKFVQMTRTVFKFGADSGLVEKAVLYGAGFKKPSKTVMRRHKARSDKKLFTAAEIWQLLDGKTVTDKSGNSKRLAGASVQLRAMILLGINAAFGNTDVGKLPLSAVDFQRGWIEFPRPKTGIERRCPLWPETVDALKAAITARPQPKTDEAKGHLFVTKRGNSWMHGTTDAVGLEFGKLLRRLGINGRRGLGFYSLRHTFATIGLQTGDRDAVKAIMGHVENDVLSEYDEEGPSAERLIAIVEHVRRWVFGANKANNMAT